MEVAPGIHRIESDLGPRFMCQYFLAGRERTLLVDTGMPETPREVIAPYLDSIGVSADAVDYVLISHADLDHSGGKAAMRELAPAARFACHELDRRWIESADAMVSENYLWHEPHGFDEPDEAGREDLRRSCGPDVPIELGLGGGETLRLEAGWRVEFLHLPGHTPGHLGVWDERSGTAIIIDAALESGIYDREGNRLIPPRYYDVRDYRDTIGRLRALAPRLLLTAHYPPMDEADAQAFLDRCLRFTEDVDALVREAVAAGETNLWELTQRANERLGPYPESWEELGAAVRAHLSVAGVE